MPFFLLLVVAFASRLNFYTEPIAPTSPPLDFPIPDDVFPFFRFDRFNFTGECGAIFRHPPHSPRDAVILALGKLELKRRDTFLQETDYALRLLRRVLPRARVVLFFFVSPPRRQVAFFSRFAVEMYRVHGLEHWNPTNARFPAVRRWLQRHAEELDRVVWSDVRDVYHFADVFRTFGVDELVLLDQGFRNIPWTVRKRVDSLWFKRFFGVHTVDEFIRERHSILNAGLILGGVQPMTHLLATIERFMPPQHLGEWGCDQATLNYAFYKGLIRIPNTKTVRCSQQMCFKIMKPFVFVDGAFVFNDETRCSPVIKHKGVPTGTIPSVSLP